MSPRGARRPALASPAGWGALVLGLLVLAALSSVGPESDYAVHAALGAELAARGRSHAPIPAPLFAWLVAAGVRVLPGLAPLSLALALGVASHLAWYAVVLRMLTSGVRPGAQRPVPGALRPAATRVQVATALALCLAAPIHVWTAAQHNLYFGYVGLATYHNPTLALLRPLALLLFCAAEGSLAAAEAGLRRPGLVRLALLSLLAALAKPSFSVVLLPALAAAAWLERRDGRRVDLARLFLGIALPTAFVLAFEYWQTFAPGAGAGPGAGIRVAPLAALGAGSQGHLAGKLLLSAAFPLAAALCAPRAAARDPGLRLAWLGFAAGLVIAALLDETGPRAGHGNFLWSAQIALTVLFAAQARWIFGAGAPARGRRRTALVAGVLALHALCGLAWLAVHVLPLLDASARPLRGWF